MSQNTPPVMLSLADLVPGQVGTVVELRSQGVQRRRMMDLGIVPGTTIGVEVCSPLGDPTAYRVRGALVALRQEQARLILVERTPNPEVNNHDS